jgi:citrate synthase
LAYREPEEVIYLLFHGDFPTVSELATYKKLLVGASKMNPKVIQHLKTLPKEGHPMKWFFSGINAIGMVSNSGNYRTDAITLVAQLPEMVAAIFRIREGWGEPIASKPELGYMENFTQMLGAPKGSANLEKLMKVFNILHYDHGGGNLSTFVGKAIASGLEDMFGSIMGSMSALAGPLHGMANQECLRFLKEVNAKIKDPSDEKEVGSFIENLLGSGGKVFGFGHAVLRVEDPRATVQYALGESIASSDPLFKLAKTLRTVGTEILKKQPKIACPYPNVDAVSGSLLNANGLTNEDYYTVLFGLSRTVGIAAQIVWERVEAREGKGMPIVRPKYLYTGPKRG